MGMGRGSRREGGRYEGPAILSNSFLREPVLDELSCSLGDETTSQLGGRGQLQPLEARSNDVHHRLNLP